MKKLLLTFTILCSLAGTAQKTTQNYPKYTLSEVYNMIANEISDTFTLKNANIVLDTVADRNYLLRKYDLETMVPIRTDSIEINKSIIFENVFTQEADIDDKYVIAFNKVIFNKPVTIKNSGIWLSYNHFKNSVNIRYDDDIYQSFKENFEDENESALIYLEGNFFEFDPIITGRSDNDESLQVALFMQDCILKGSNEIRDISWFFSRFNFVRIENNRFLNEHPNYISFSGNRGLINNNDFGNRLVKVFIPNKGVKGLEFRENTINKPFMLSLPESIENLQMDWNQFSSGIIDMTKYGDFAQNISKANSSDDYDLGFRNENVIRHYSDSARIVNNLFYKSEIALLGTLNSIDKRQHDLESANASYIALKDLETKRLQFLYKENPSFRTYFKWKVNQFLKLFSDYGTEPSKAIVFSVYVIIFFALIYLFFPNHWDSHGKNRIMDRYRFFLKYVNKNAGIHEVYLDEKKPELLDAEDFKTYLLQQGKTAPKFFTSTALPLYRWSIAGTKTFSWLLSKIDILKGTWSETSPSKQKWKSVLIFLAFFFAIVYDLFIKVLNALMLSINTFTTLGFGEIPIKGLPRYLAIIQGFIGWFMLTIFSVSLISQLLN